MVSTSSSSSSLCLFSFFLSSLPIPLSKVSLLFFLFVTLQTSDNITEGAYTESKVGDDTTEGTATEVVVATCGTAVAKPVVDEEDKTLECSRLSGLTSMDFISTMEMSSKSES